MLHSYLIAALRNLGRNKLYAGINIIGLAVGFWRRRCADSQPGYVRHETSYDAWLPNSDSTYMLVTTATKSIQAERSLSQLEIAVRPWRTRNGAGLA